MKIDCSRAFLVGIPDVKKRILVKFVICHQNTYIFDRLIEESDSCAECQGLSTKNMNYEPKKLKSLNIAQYIEFHDSETR